MQLLLGRELVDIGTALEVLVQLHAALDPHAHSPETT